MGVAIERRLVIWGASGHALVLHEFVSALGYRLEALFDNRVDATSPIPGIPVFHGRDGFEQWVKANPAALRYGLAAIGGDRGKDRREVLALFSEAGIVPATVIHPTAFVAADVALGPGTQVLANATVCAGARLGAACIVNTAASVDHESILEDGVHVAPGARLAGCVEVGENSMVGVGAIVLPRIRIGKFSVIGAGAVVTRDVPAGTVAFGNPARVKGRTR